MDREQFDRLGRLVAAAGTRRDALRLLASGLVLGVAGSYAGSTFARKKSGKRSPGKARAQVQQPPPPPSCPSTCNQDCSGKAIQGGANLTRCDLSGRDLEGVNLGGANLTQACFGNATLRDASFRGANLSKACLCGADLAGADFRGANVTKQQLACATVTCETTLPNGKSAAPCAKGLTCCGNLCVPTKADPGNCGACGNVCRPPATCDNGRCRVQPGTCLPPDADLQAAINATGGSPVNQTPTLTLCEGRFAAVGLVVSPDNAPLGLNIVGAGQGKTILDGQGQTVVLRLQGLGPNAPSPALLNLIGLTVTNSGGGLGGLINAADILNGGQLPYLTLSSVEVSGNAGSGIVNEGYLALYVNTHITNNTNSTFDGGGIYTSNVGGGLGVSADSRIDHNTAVAGGGIFLGAGTVTLQSASSVHDNFPNNCASQDPSKTIPNCIN
jgi:hypothetical protein